jgi:Spy/CpxP family protein refolding chaperone
VAAPSIALSQGQPSAPPEQSQPAQPQSKLDEQQQALATALKLTDEQKSQFQAIQEGLQAQVQYILTPEQQAKAAELGNNTQAASALNLSPEQQTRIQEAEGSAKIRFLTILTPAQIGALNQFMEQSRRKQ